IRHLTSASPPHFRFQVSGLILPPSVAPSSAMPPAASSPLPIDLDPASSFRRRVATWGAGFGMSLGILIVLAHVQRTEITPPAPPIADLRTVVLEEAPPPPPEIATKEPPPPTV